jgi:transcriptional regulator with XRE-family HTH domain
MRKSVHTRAYKVLQDRLVAARHAAGLTQQDLAKKLGRPQSFIAKYEGGERRLDIVELLIITQLLGVDERRLIGAVKAEV